MLAGFASDPFGWSPWEQLERLQEEMDRLFSERRVTASYPPVNVWVGENDVVVTAELPGYGAEDLDISVQGPTVTLKSAEKPEDNAEESKYLLRERRCGGFTRRFDLPFEIDADQVAASFRNGVLRLELPRSEADRPRRIAVEAN